MARMTIKGLSEYSQQLNQLYAVAEPLVKKCLYDGAGVMADAVKGAIGTIPTRNNREFGGEGHMLTGLTAQQKAGLTESFGISPMRSDGREWNVKCGFDGYNSVRTKKYPNGEPNAMIARSIESGTSFLQPCHFISRAVNATRGAVEAKMAATCDKEITKIMK